MADFLRSYSRDETSVQSSPLPKKFTAYVSGGKKFATIFQDLGVILLDFLLYDRRMSMLNITGIC